MRGESDMNRRVAVYILVALTVLMLVDGKYGLFDTTAPYRHLVRIEEAKGAGLDPGTPSAEKSGLLEEMLGPGQVLRLNNALGHINVTGTPGAERAQLNYNIYVYAANEAVGEAYLDRLDIRVVQSETGLDVRLVEPAKRPEEVHQVRLDVSASIPSEARVEIYNNMGTVRVENVSGPSIINNAFGDTTIKEVGGKLNVDAAYTNLDVTRVRGDLVVKGSYGSSSLRNIDGNVTVESDFRTTSLTDVKGDIEAEISFGGIAANEIDGDIKTKGAYTIIGARNVTGSAIAHTEYGTVRFQGIGKDMIVDARRSDVTIILDQVPDHRISLETENGSLALQGTLSKLQPQTGEAGKKMVNAVVGAGTHSIEVRNVQGSISISHPPHP